MNGEGRNPSGSAISLVKKILTIKKCYGKDELLEALELTREALEPTNLQSNSKNSKIFAVLHRLYAKYLKELEVPTSNSDHRNLIIHHAKKAVSLCPNSTEYRYFYASLLFEEGMWVPDEEVIKQCRRALQIGAGEEDPYWTIFLMDDDGYDQDAKSKVEKVTNGVKDLMLKVKLREEERKKNGGGGKPAKAEQSRPPTISRHKF